MRMWCSVLVAAYACMAHAFVLLYDAQTDGIQFTPPADWTMATNTTSRLLGTPLIMSMTAGSTIELSFIGTEVALLGNTQDSVTTYDIHLDDASFDDQTAKATNIDNTKQLFLARGLRNTTHTIILAVKGTGAVMFDTLAVGGDQVNTFGLLSPTDTTTNTGATSTSLQTAADATYTGSVRASGGGLSGRTIAIIAGVAGGVVALFVAAIIVYVFVIRRSRRAPRRDLILGEKSPSLKARMINLPFLKRGSRPASFIQNARYSGGNQILAPPAPSDESSFFDQNRMSRATSLSLGDDPERALSELEKYDGPSPEGLSRDNTQRSQRTFVIGLPTSVKKTDDDPQQRVARANNTGKTGNTVTGNPFVDGASESMPMPVRPISVVRRGSAIGQYDRVVDPITGLAVNKDGVAAALLKKDLPPSPTQPTFQDYTTQAARAAGQALAGVFARVNPFTSGTTSATSAGAPNMAPAPQPVLTDEQVMEATGASEMPPPIPVIPSLPPNPKRTSKRWTGRFKSRQSTGSTSRRKSKKMSRLSFRRASSGGESIENLGDRRDTFASDALTDLTLSSIYMADDTSNPFIEQVPVLRRDIGRPSGRQPATEAEAASPAPENMSTPPPMPGPLPQPVLPDAKGLRRLRRATSIISVDDDQLLIKSPDGPRRSRSHDDLQARRSSVISSLDYNLRMAQELERRMESNSKGTSRVTSRVPSKAAANAAAEVYMADGMLSRPASRGANINDNVFVLVGPKSLEDLKDDVPRDMDSVHSRRVSSWNRLAASAKTPQSQVPNVPDVPGEFKESPRTSISSNAFPRAMSEEFLDNEVLAEDDVSPDDSVSVASPRRNASMASDVPYSISVYYE